jgi:Protein of unknown function (DUF2442)
MTAETSEARIIPHTNTHWEIIRAYYEGGSLYAEFQDGTGGAIPVSQFSALANATKEDFEDLQVSPCGLLIENGHVEWDCAEAGLYKLINSQQDR